MRRVGFFGIVLLSMAAVLPAAAQDDKTQLTLKVLRESDKTPLADAHIVIHFTEERLLRDKRGTWETKTNRKGEVMLPNVPLGTAKVQVIARGYQTYGNQHEFTKPEEEVTILLKPPQKQVSAY
ncbi:MAG: carboxypeptidase-like regulatory domain-containing protein [Terriglobia bacterium]